MKRNTLLSLALAASTLAGTLTTSAATPKMKAPAGGKAISDELIGIFFEDISHAADGGLYAELVQNGSFEYGPTERDGWGAGTAWKNIRPGHSMGYIQPISIQDGEYVSTYMKIFAERTRHFYDFSGWSGFGIQNDGFDGIPLKQNAKYDFSIRILNNDGKKKQIRIALVEPAGRGRNPKLLADDTLNVATSDEWKQFTSTLIPTEDCKNAALQILVLDEGTVNVDDISLMPQDTYKGHGLRKDLAQALADLQPKFMRFPGGCVVHGGGEGMWNTYRWKNTLGPKWQRRQMKNTWGYHQSMGLGYYEYFQFCEDVGMQPLPILPCGVSCQGGNGGWGLRDQAQDVVPMSEMDEWVQDVLDLIEWANGDPATSEWAKKRAEQGHPEPFNLKYVGLGNEERISDEFIERFKYIYNIVTEKHPEIVIVGTAGPGSHPGNWDYERGWKLAEEIDLPIIDEHYYENRRYFLANRQYDSYPRDRKTKVYLGEYAAKDKKLIDALAEALYLIHVEHNGDVVAMTSYAPLFARKNLTNWNPDLIYFDNERPYLTCSYYVQQMFGQSSGQYYYGNCVTIEGADNLQEQSTILNVNDRKLYVKICNASDTKKTATVDLSRFSLKKDVKVTTLTGDPDAENNFEQQPIAPTTETEKAKKRFTLDVAPYSFVMFEYQL